MRKTLEKIFFVSFCYTVLEEKEISKKIERRGKDGRRKEIAPQPWNAGDIFRL